MKIELYPQYKLYKFTRLLNANKKKFQKPYTGKRAVNGTIINRAYYSAYSYVLLWLEEEIPNFRLKQKWEYEVDGKKIQTEHQQVRDHLKKLGKKNLSKNLYELHSLRKKADYDFFNPLTEEDVVNSIRYMNNIFNELKFEK